MKAIKPAFKTLATVLLAGWLMVTPLMAAYDLNMTIAVKKGGGFTSGDEGGDYHLAMLGFYDIDTPVPESESIWGELSLSPTPPFSWQLDGTAYLSNNTTPITGFSAGGGYTFDTADGVLDMDIPMGSEPGLAGYLAAGGQIMALRHAYTDPLDGVVLKTGLALAKDSGPFNATLLDGTYRLRGKELTNFHSADREASILWGTMTFDGAGEWTAAISIQSSTEGGGAVDIPAFGTYSVDLDGRLTLIFDSGRTLHGHLSADADLFLLSLGTRDGSDPEVRVNSLLVGMKERNGYSAGDLNGEYLQAELHLFDIGAASASDRDGSVSWGSLNFDGVGQFTGHFTELDARTGTPVAGNTVAGTYTITANGAVEASVSEHNGSAFSALLQGHLSGDGQLLVLTRAEPVAPDNGDGDGGGGDSGGDSGGGSGGGCFIAVLR